MQSGQEKKVLIIGDSNVGKTSIMLRIVRNEFDEYSMPTLGTGFKVREIQFKDNQKMQLSIWDTAGQEKFDSLTKIYFKHAEAALIVYDVTNK